MKNLKIIIPTVLILLVGVVVLVLTISKDDKKEMGTKNDDYTTIILSINPKLALEIDKEKKVINMYPLNEDAIVFDRDTYIGLSLEKSIDKVIDDAKDYLQNDKTITISLTNKNHVKESEIEKFIKANDEEIEIDKVILTKKEIDDIKEQINDIKEQSKTTSTTSTTSTTTTTNEKSTTTKEKTTKKEKSKNNDLSSLSVEGITINFKKNTLNYEGIVAYDKAKVKITAKADDSKAKVSGTGSKELEVGENTFKIKVTAEDKSTKTYTIKITRRPQYNLNDNVEVNTLYGITIGHYVYPTVDACIGKNPYEMTIPEGKTYDEYCGNKITITNYPDIKGNGYICTKSRHVMDDDGIGMTSSAAYGCNWIKGVADQKEMDNKIIKVLEAGGKNALNIGGGLGSGDPITLDEEACKKYNVTCGRW